MTMKTRTFETTSEALVVRDLNSLDSILCEEGELEDALRELNPDAPQEVEDAIEMLADKWGRDEYVNDLLSYLGIEITEAGEGAFTYECTGHYNDETYNSVRNRIANLWGFEPSDIVNVDWSECHNIFVGGHLVTTPTSVDYEVLQDGNYASYTTDFVRNYCTSI